VLLWITVVSSLAVQELLRFHDPVYAARLEPRPEERPTAEFQARLELLPALIESYDRRIAELERELAETPTRRWARRRDLRYLIRWYRDLKEKSVEEIADIRRGIRAYADRLRSYIPAQERLFGIYTRSYEECEDAVKLRWLELETFERRLAARSEIEELKADCSRRRYQAWRTELRIRTIQEKIGEPLRETLTKLYFCPIDDKEFETIEELTKHQEEHWKPPVVKFYRLMKCHLWYARTPERKTPNPYAMVATFVYTQEPDKYPEDDFDSALEYIEEIVIPQFGYAVTAGTVYYNVVAFEREEVDEDEVEYRLDQMRYYVAFYYVAAPNIWKIKGEYWGSLEIMAGAWTHRDETKTAVKPRGFPTSRAELMMWE
jgi:hypothetical protein